MKNGNDLDVARGKIFDCLENLKLDPVENDDGEIILTDDQYNEIKKIMKDKTFNPTKKNIVWFQTHSGNYAGHGI